MSPAAASRWLLTLVVMALGVTACAVTPDIETLPGVAAVPTICPTAVADQPDVGSFSGPYAGSELCLGPAAFDGATLASVETRLDNSGTWLLSLRFRDGAEGIDRYNDLASQCFQRLASCPLSRLVVMVDDVVLTGVTVDAPTYGIDAVAWQHPVLTPEAGNTLGAALTDDPSTVTFRAVLAAAGEPVPNAE